MLAQGGEGGSWDQPPSTAPPQAVDLLASGKTVTDTATAVEVTRQTVSEWLNHHPGFQAALHSRRQGLFAQPPKKVHFNNASLS